MLSEGDKLPKLTVVDDTGAKIRLADLADEYLVLYFYPKDDTPGCTSEGMQFRDAAKAFGKKKARIVGVSRDSVASHQKFKAKYDLPFTLLADTDQALCDAFDVIDEKNMYGKKVKGVIRSTFLIDGKGAILKVWPKVKVDGHVAEVLASIT
ncbi:MAG TPA: peroxiredoxin [Candidatus Baltobacteraceae bacterium]